MTDTMTHEETPSEIVGGEGHGLLTLPDGSAIPYKPHPLAELFPMMSADEHAALVEDVKERGVQRPIVLLDRMVLDGRNRYMAARDAEVGYRVVEFDDPDPVAFVISENLRRRHLTDSQRAMVGAKIAKLPKGGDRREEQTANWRTAPTTAQTAELLNTSVRGIERARVVVEAGAPELIEAASSGEVTVSAAAEVAKLPQTEQVEIVAQGPAAVKEAAKAARQAKAETVAPSEPTEKKKPNGLSGLTREGLEDEVIGLRETVEDLKAQLRAAKDDLKAAQALIKELSAADDKNRKISMQAREIDVLNGRIKEHMATVKRMEFRLKKAEEERDRLRTESENQMIAL